MQDNLRPIFWITLLMSFASMAYFFSLTIGAPFAIVVIATCAFGYFSYRWLAKNKVEEASIKHSRWAIAILVGGVVIITNKSYYIEQKYGEWDTWYIWNYHARFLQFAKSWQRMFVMRETFFHPSYPLFLPSLTAFCWRLCGRAIPIVPYTVSFFVSLMIPVSIFLALYRRNLAVAGLALILFGVSDLFLDHGLAQYADLPLGFMFLCVFICLNQSQGSNNFSVLLAAALLGCCLWVKNEGTMLAAIFTLFYLRTFLANGRWKYFIAGISFPLLIYIVFRNIAPKTDFIQEQPAGSWRFLLEGARYKLIWSYLVSNLNQRFQLIKVALILYSILCVVEKKLPDKNMLLLLACMAGYFIVYLFIPEGLWWRLGTSLDRVIFQLVPSFVYIIGLRFCNVKLSLNTADPE